MATGLDLDKIGEMKEKSQYGDKEPGEIALEALKRRGRKEKRKYLFMALLLVLLLLGGYYGYPWLLFRLSHVSTDDAQVKGEIVSVSSRVSGRLVSLLVGEGDTVTKAQVIAELEQATFLQSVARAEATWRRTVHQHTASQTNLALTRQRVESDIADSQVSVDRARETLEISQAETGFQKETTGRALERAAAALNTAQARVAEAKATLDHARLEAERAKNLYESGIVSKSNWDSAETAFQTARARYEAALEAREEAVAGLNLARANLQTVEIKLQQQRVEQANYQKAKVALKKAQDERAQTILQEKVVEQLKAQAAEMEAVYRSALLDLKDTVIRSPMGGTVFKKMVNQGEMIQPGQPLLLINNLAQIWVEANLEETKVRNVRPGALAEVKVDAYPGRRFKGRVEFVGSAAISEFSLIPPSDPKGNFVKVTHRIPVRIRVENNDQQLRPGMMVQVFINTKELTP